MSSSQMAWHHAYSKVRIWLVDLLLQNNAFFVIFFKKCVREQLLDLIFVISTLQISQKPHPIIVYNNNNNNNNNDNNNDIIISRYYCYYYYYKHV